MIAVWLVGPPSSVTMPTTWSRSSVAVSAGARSAATTTDGLDIFGSAWRGHAEHLGDDPVPHVPQVGDPLGHQAAHAGEDGDELLDARMHRSEQVLPLLQQVLADRAAQTLVAGQAGARRQHLRGVTRDAAGLAHEPVGHRLRGFVVRRKRRVGVGEPGPVEACDRLGRDLGPHHESGCEGDAGDHGSAAGGRGLRWSPCRPVNPFRG